MRKVAVLSFACAFLAVLSVAFAQSAPTKFTHYFAGDFLGADQRNAGSWARYNTADGWVQLPISPDPSVPKKIIFHPSDSNILFVLVGGNVFQYDVTSQSYIALGETLGSVNDLFAVGDSLFVAGGNFGLQPRDVTPTNIARRSLAADPRSNWEAFPNSAAQQIGLSVNTFVASGVAGGSPIARVGSTLYWQRTTDGVWTSVADAAEVGVNLRGPAGANTVIADRLEYSGGYIWARNLAGGFTLSADTSVTHLIVRSTDGRTWESVLAAATFAPPSEYSIFSSAFYDSVADGTYFIGSRTTTAAPFMTNNALFFVRRGETSVAQVGDSFLNINTATTRLFRSGNMVYAIHQTDLVVYTESTTSDEPNFTQFRSKRKLQTGVSAVDVTSGTAGWNAALGGGLGGAGASESTPVAVSSDGANIYIGIAASTTWNVAAYGLAAMDSDGKLWPFGNPLRDGEVDNVDAGTTRTIRTVAHYNNDDGTTQTVIIGGNFRRHNNITLNSLAWADSSSPSTWNPFGNAGVAQPGGVVVPASTSNYYDNPGNVYALTYMPDPEGRANARIVFVGGMFSQSGDVAINNIGRYYLKGSNTWSNLKGGVSNIDGSAARVNAIDYIGRKVFVGGSFTRAGNVSALNIAMWDDKENTWTALGSGVSGQVHHILARAENDVWVVGALSVAGGVDISNIARWDGSTWSPVYCDRCAGGCEKGVTDGKRACPTGTTGYQLKNMNGRIHLVSSGSLYIYDGSMFRDYVSFPGGAFRQTLSTAPSHIEGGNHIMIATSRAVSSNIRSRLTIYNTDTHNYANYNHGGFDNVVRAVSSSSVLAPFVFVTLIAALLAALL